MRTETDHSKYIQIYSIYNFYKASNIDSSFIFTLRHSVNYITNKVVIQMSPIPLPL